MKEYLSKLNKYSVDINLNLDTFLRKANLTEKEKEYLAEHIGSIKLLYRIPFENKQEILFYQAVLSKWDSEYVERNVAKSIASSMPYDCIVGLQNGKATKYFTFNRSANTQNERRSVISDCVWSLPVVPERGNDYDQMIESALETALTKEKDPERVFNYLKNEFYLIVGAKKAKQEEEDIEELNAVVFGQGKIKEEDRISSIWCEPESDDYYRPDEDETFWTPSDDDDNGSADDLFGLLS